jgi:hypothetical protein
MFKTKKGIELSINFIVMLILAIVGFVMGLMFIPQLFKASTDMYQQLDSQSKDILMNQAMEGRVAIYPENFQTKVGSGRVVGLGIYNVGNTQNFTVGIKYVSGTETDGTDIPPSLITMTEWAMVDSLVVDWYPYKVHPTIEVKRNDRDIESIFFKAPAGALRGKYTFAILVRKDALNNGWTATDENYAGSKLVTITVV